MNRWKLFAAGATTALLVVGVSGGTAWAAGSSTTPGARGGGFAVSGTLVSVGNSSLAFKLADGTVATATLSSSTVYTKTATVPVSALKKGQTVTVTGTESAGVIPATRIIVGQSGFGGFGGFGGRRPEGAGGGTPRSFPEGAPGHFGEGYGGQGFGGGNFTPPTFGTISAVSGTSFTLTESNKTKVKVTTSSTTTITETSKITKSGLTVGQTLSIRGTEKSNTVVAATSVSEGNLGFGGFGGGGDGIPGGGGAPPAA